MQDTPLDEHLIPAPLYTYKNSSLPELRTLPSFIMIGSLGVYGLGYGWLLSLAVLVFGLIVYVLSFSDAKTSFHIYPQRIEVYNYYSPKRKATLSFAEIAEVQYNFWSYGKDSTLLLKLKPTHRFQAAKAGAGSYYLNFHEQPERLTEEQIRKVFAEYGVPTINFWDKKLTESMGANWREQVNAMRRGGS